MNKLNPVLIRKKDIETRHFKERVLVFDTDVQNELNITVSENDSGQLIILVRGNHAVVVKVCAQTYSDYSILWIYDDNCEYRVDETIELKRGSSLNYYIAQLSNQNILRKTEVTLREPHADFKLRSTSLAGGIVKWNQHIVHASPLTYASVENYGIVYREAQYLLDVCSHILKGMKQSETHQNNRIMNMNEKPRARVFPQLIIDENDVKASHAATVGQPNPNEVYYMQSRGLSYRKAIQLLSLGYVMPLLEIVEDASVYDYLSKLFETKVLSHG